MFFMQPLSSYNFFYTLANRDKRGLDRISDILNQFSLFGFVIYDAVEHHTFKSKLQESYDYLDSITGNKFLFFSVIEMGHEQRYYFKGRPTYEALRKLEEAGRAIANPVIADYKDSLAFSLAAHLEIDLKYLPVIVLSNNLEFGNKAVVSINSDNVEDYLFKFGKIARSNLRNNNQIDINDILLNENILNISNLYISPPNINLNKAIYDVTGCYEFNGYYGHYAKPHINSLIEQLKANLTKYILNNDVIDIEKTLLKLIAIYAVIYPPNKFRNEIILDENKLDRPLICEWQDSVTKIYLKTFYSISKNKLFVDDYSPVALPLAKAFENEIILSYFNWLRMEMNVPMPDFYNKPFGKEPLLINSKNVNGYKKYPHELIPLGLGTITSCVDFLYKNENKIPEFHTKEDIDFIRNNFYKINDSRNSIAHAGILFSESDCNNLEKYISSVFSDSFGDKINKLKNLLSTRNI